MTVAKIWTPRIENIKSRSIIKAPTLAKEGIVKMMVLNITLKNFALVINLKIRPILKALAIVVCFGPMSLTAAKPIIRVT